MIIPYRPTDRETAATVGAISIPPGIMQIKGVWPKKYKLTFPI